MEVVASLSQGRTAAAQCGFFTYKSIPVIFEPPFKCPLPPVTVIKLHLLHAVFLLISYDDGSVRKRLFPLYSVN